MFLFFIVHQLIFELKEFPPWMLVGWTSSIKNLVYVYWHLSVSSMLSASISVHVDILLGFPCASCWFRCPVHNEYQLADVRSKIHISKLFANAIVCHYFCPMIISSNLVRLLCVCLCKGVAHIGYWMDWDFVFVFHLRWLNWPNTNCSITECTTFAKCDTFSFCFLVSVKYFFFLWRSHR